MNVTFLRSDCQHYYLLIIFIRLLLTILSAGISIVKLQSVSLYAPRYP